MVWFLLPLHLLCVHWVGPRLGRLHRVRPDRQISLNGNSNVASVKGLVTIRDLASRPTEYFCIVVGLTLNASFDGIK
ncbi:hypothetical protein R6Q57_004099 [Mikania cordata]